MLNNIRHRTSYGALAAFMMLATTNANAQDSSTEAASADEQDNEIVVLARKRAENIVDVPIAVSIVGQDQLERDQVFNMNDLSRTTPSLEINQGFGGESNGGGRVRGIGTALFNASVSSSVALVIDQVPIGNLNFPQLYDLAQVETLSGPQGTLFGQGASAGVINIRTAAPQLGEVSGRADISYADKGTAGSEYGEQVYNAAINVPIGETVAVRVAGQYRVDTGLQRRMNAIPAEGRPAGEDTVISDLGVRAQVLLEPTDNFRVNFTAQYAKNESDGHIFGALGFAPNSTRPFGPPGQTLGGFATGQYLRPDGCAMTEISQRGEQFCEAQGSYTELTIGGMSSVIDFDVTDELSITSVTSYRERSYDQTERSFSRLSTSTEARRENISEKSNGFSQELRLTYDTDGLAIVSGLFYTNYNYETAPRANGTINFGINSVGLDGDPVGFSVCNAAGLCFVAPRFDYENTSNRTYAVFADTTVDLLDTVSLFGGLRYDNFRNDTGFGTNTLSATEQFTLKEDAVSGRIGISWQPVAGSNIYASFARGYKPPAVGRNLVGDLFQLDGEDSDAFEIGIKYDLNGIQIAGNLYHNTVKNFQAQTNILDPNTQGLVSTPLNVKQVVSKGFEVTAFGDISSNFSFNLGYIYNDVTFPSGFLAEVTGEDLGGKQFLLAPKHKFSASGEFTLPISGGTEFFVNANVVYKSGILFAARTDPRYTFPGHELVNGGLGVRNADGGWNVSIFVRNLTKQREPLAYLPTAFANIEDGGIRVWPIGGITTRVVGVRAGFEF